jgi:hypothetical protein
MSEQNQKITLELTLPELRAIQNTLKFVTVIKSIIEVAEGDELKAVGEKIDSFIGLPFKLRERQEIEAGMRLGFKDDPVSLAEALQSLDRDYPLPPAYRQ